MLRDYQIKIAEDATETLKVLESVYLALQVRVGKTRIAFQIAKNIKASSVLFITKKKAIESVLKDYADECFDFPLKVINYEAVVKIESWERFDLIVIDEAHSLGAFPKPSGRTTKIRALAKKCGSRIIFLSGTPTPESYSQIFHQFWVSPFSPFPDYNFYTWARKYVRKTERVFNGIKVVDYSDADKKAIDAIIKPFFHTFTQEEAGFEQAVTERAEVVTDSCDKHELQHLKKHRCAVVWAGDKSHTITADTPAKLMQKCHQLSAGTVIADDGERLVVSYAKAEHCKRKAQNSKIAIFYKYVAERDALLETFEDGAITESFEEFKTTNKTFISQISSGAMGTDLSCADELVFYNIDFSSVLYWQARARIQTFSRNRAAVVTWLFSEHGIEREIYQRVLQKKNFTVSYFLKVVK